MENWSPETTQRARDWSPKRWGALGRDSRAGIGDGLLCTTKGILRLHLGAGTSHGR